MRKKLLVCASLLLLFSCSDENLVAVGDVSADGEDLAERSVYNVTYEEAVNMALNAPRFFKTTQTKGGEKKVGQCVPILSDAVATKGAGVDTLVYLINYADEQGFTFIPKDGRKGDYLAFVDNGSFNVADTATNELTKYLYHCITNYCKAEVIDTKWYDATYDGTYKEYVGDFTAKTGAGCSRVGSANMYEYHKATYEGRMPNMGDYYVTKGCKATLKVRKFIEENGVDPLLTTSWGQAEPFNNKAPLIEGFRPPAGCVATAIVQVLAYHGFPDTYPENVVVDGVDVSGTPTNLKMLRQYRYAFARDNHNGEEFCDYVSTIYRYVGDVMKNKWSLYGTGAYTRDAPFCFYRLGYSTKNTYFIIDYDRSRLINSLDNGRPVIISGEDYYGGAGHAWVIDGYRYLLNGTSTFYFSESGKLDFRDDRFSGPSSPVLYISCNFGSHGQSNGFYLDDVFNTTNGSIVETKSIFIKPRIIVDIRP